MSFISIRHNMQQSFLYFEDVLVILFEMKGLLERSAGIISAVQYLWSSSLGYKQAVVLREWDKAPPFSLSIPQLLCDLLESKSL